MQPLIFFFNVIIFVVSIFLLVFYTGTISNDFAQYELIFNQISNSGRVIDAVLQYRYEPGFTMLYYYLSVFFSAQNTFLMIASFILTIKYSFFHRYLKYPISAWFFYAILFMPVLDASQLRTAIASTIIIYLLLTPSTTNGYVFKTVFASMFHYVALISILFQSYRKPILTVIMTLFIALSLDYGLGFISGDIFKFTAYLSSSYSMTQSVNYFNLISISQLFLCLYCIINWKHLNDVQKKGGLLIIIGMLLYFTLGKSPGIAHRIREVSLLGIFPLLFSIKVNFNYKSILAYSSVLFICTYHFVYIVVELINL